MSEHSYSSSFYESDLLTSFDLFDCSLGGELNVSSENFTAQPTTESYHESINKRLKEVYLENVRPFCLDLGRDCSFSQLFTGGHKTEEELRAFVEKRVGRMVDQIKKSSCLNIQNCTENFTNPTEVNYNNELTYRKEEHHNRSFTSNLNPTSEGDYFNGTFNRINYGSVEVLNSSATNLNMSVMNDPFKPADQSYCLQKSFSSNCLLGKSLRDMRMGHRDSSYSEEKLDQWGLPMNKFSNLDHKEFMKKLTQLRDSTIAPQQDLKSCENNADGEGALNLTFTADVGDKLVPSEVPVEECVNTKTNAGTSRGPMKAFAPLHSMTKQMAEKIMSPFKKKKMEPNPKVNNAGSSLCESFNDGLPIASSTPTGERQIKKEMNSGFSFTRSLSEGRMTPVKSKAGTILNVSYTKSRPSLSGQSSSVSAHQKNNVPTKLPDDSTLLKKTIKQPLLSKPKLRTSLLVRPSLVPMSKLTSRLNMPGSSTAEQQQKKVTALRPVNSVLSKGKPSISTDKKLVKRTSVIDKENKRRLN